MCKIQQTNVQIDEHNVCRMTEWSIAQITFTLADGSDESFLLGKGKLGTEEMLEGKQFTIITNRVKNR